MTPSEVHYVAIAGVHGGRIINHETRQSSEAAVSYLASMYKMTKQEHTLLVRTNYVLLRNNLFLEVKQCSCDKGR